MELMQTETLWKLIPVLYLLAALPAALGRGRVERSWQAAIFGATAAPVLTLAGSAFGVWKDALTFDSLGAMILLLVTGIGAIIARFSRTYLAGEANQQRYIGALLVTLAMVSVVIQTDHLGVLAIAWMTSSLGLHRLLLHYEQRPTAVIAAHKKFLASRLADVFLLGAVALVATGAGTLSLPALAAGLENVETLPLSLHAAALLIAMAVLLRSAQVPFHGWITQVMEAPTPVSALLHAGVVNVGGFVLIRLASLISAAPAAQALLVVAGSVTALVAALVMTTRISIKVKLAWSTCAQMGFMLMQCGLGLYEFALIHLLAHSIYKAHAFLTAGSTVSVAKRKQLTSASAPSGALVQVGIGALAVAMVWTIGSAWMPGEHQLPAAMALIAGLALLPLLDGNGSSSNGRDRVLGLVVALAVVNLYFGLHSLLSSLNAVPVAAAGAPLALQAWVALCFSTLFLMQVLMSTHRDSALVHRLYPWAYCGLYLDEHFTRLTFKMWPAKRPEPAPLETATAMLVAGDLS